ncbi:NAD(P)-dependent dehydrogenase (short-subunit alcohol dehydrogenase family) [Mucilaginibacter frigoritolerans]|uniref:NAD(P)-dependent dehydrogenase (Short-subunit alcohol dehydrogenase family) n=1 Tax=Mucilaginibacter frigoritolerans TaxID=652788 RepID=A0A562U555_9SPHI|nr:SDR family NAD(P)-dependent oxidoreductase [Mucilaginibacter frigoritolerans]TWJ00928.1 NAD(P)-dependent dehydrogenase (short-subunit alcohol dehydrogenase family) [Mucilaginibacter frigoritolerans]
MIQENKNKKKVWFVTGASKGLGLALVKLLLQKGDKVAATSRNATDIENKISATKENLLALTVDITNEESVNSAIDKTIEKFGGLDVIVNNAGYGILGSIEALTGQEFRDCMSVNVFGAFNVIHAAMPYLRKQKSGYIFNISSVAGYKGFSNSSSYASSKFAMIGLSEALAEEVKEFGINVTVVAPGYFRTSFLEEGSFLMAKNRIAEYNVEERETALKQMNGNQQGDPDKLVAALVKLTEEPNPPVHLLMGPDAWQMLADKRKAEQEEFDTWKHVTISTNFDNL